MEEEKNLPVPPGPTPDMAATPSPENETVPESGTVAEIKTIVEKYTPGVDLSSQEAVDAAVLSLLKALDRVQTKLTVAVENDPELGSALAEIMNGGKGRVALARSYGPDAFKAIEGDPDYDEMTKAYQEAETRIKQKEEYGTTLRKNQEMSIQEIKAWMDEKNYGDEEVRVRLEKMEELRQDFLNDKITKKHMMLIDKALDYDKDVANAEEAGKVTARNEKIVEKREKASANKTIPQLTATGTKPKSARPTSLLQQLLEEEQ